MMVVQTVGKKVPKKAEMLVALKVGRWVDHWADLTVEHLADH